MDRHRQPPQATADFYRAVLTTLEAGGVPALVGGAYALRHYTRIHRDTKDLDVFMTPDDGQRALDCLSAAGFRTEMTFPHWIGKAFGPDHALVDCIFASANGACPVDDEWFAQAPKATVLEVPVRLIPAEEMIWQKSFIMERERYDGADVLHLVHDCSPSLDWHRLLRRFGDYWPVLLSHLVMFGFVYPEERGLAPAWLMQDLTDRLARALDTAEPKRHPPLCRGPLLSIMQYQVDTRIRGYQDGRLVPDGQLTPQDVAILTEAFPKPF